MKLFDQYKEAVRAAFPNPSTAMAGYINGLDTINKGVEDKDIEAEINERTARWKALSDDEQIACQSIAATL